MPQLTANQITIAFDMPETISLMKLCTDLGYSQPTVRTPWAEKTFADGSRLQFHRDVKQQCVFAIWYGNVTDWGVGRFAIDTIYHDLAEIGYVAPSPPPGPHPAPPVNPGKPAIAPPVYGAAENEQAFIDFFVSLSPARCP